MTAASYSSGSFPRKLNKRESKVVETAVAAAAAADPASVQTLTNKTIDGDDNTIKDLAVTCLKTSTGNADKVVMGTASTGVPKFDKITESNVATVAGNADKVLMGTSTTGVPKFDKIVNANVDSSAAIAGSKLNIGTQNHVAIVGAGGAATSEATLAKSRGGCGADMSSVTFPSSGTIQTTDNSVKMVKATLQYSMLAMGSAVAFGTVLPAGAEIVGAGMYVTSAFTSDNTNSASIAIHVKSANDLITAAAVSGAPWSSATTAVKCTGTAGAALAFNDPTKWIRTGAADQLTATTVANGATAFTAGEATIWVMYV